MGPVTTPPVEEARSIFNELGYDIAGDGGEFSATRKWRSVRVRAVTETDDTPESGELRCFVAWREHASGLRRRLLQSDPEYEWAIIAVDGDDYEVERAPPVAGA